MNYLRAMRFAASTGQAQSANADLPAIQQRAMAMLAFYQRQALASQNALRSVMQKSLLAANLPATSDVAGKIQPKRRRRDRLSLWQRWGLGRHDGSFSPVASDCAGGYRFGWAAKLFHQQCQRFRHCRERAGWEIPMLTVMVLPTWKMPVRWTQNKYVVGCVQTARRLLDVQNSL